MNQKSARLIEEFILKIIYIFELVRPNGVWTDAGMDGVGLWTQKDVTEELDTSFYTDMRLEDTTWVPPDR